MYILVDLKKGVANGYKDLKRASKDANCDYRTLKRRLEEGKSLVKDEIHVFEGEYFKSNKGNPLFFK